MPDTDSELAKVAERLRTLVETNKEIKQTANDALNASNTAQNDILVEATRIDGQIELCARTFERKPTESTTRQTKFAQKFGRISTHPCGNRSL